MERQFDQPVYASFMIEKHDLEKVKLISSLLDKSQSEFIRDILLEAVKKHEADIHQLMKTKLNQTFGKSLA